MLLIEFQDNSANPVTVNAERILLISPQGSENTIIHFATLEHNIAAPYKEVKAKIEVAYALQQRLSQQQHIGPSVVV